MFFKKRKDVNNNDITSLDLKPLSRVCERDSNTYTEKILGNTGMINIIEDELVVMCDNKIVFRGYIKDVKTGELLNLSGITINGFDNIEKRVKTIVAYYKRNEKFGKYLK